MMRCILACKTIAADNRSRVDFLFDQFISIFQKLSSNDDLVFAYKTDELNLITPFQLFCTFRLLH